MLLRRHKGKQDVVEAPVIVEQAIVEHVTEELVEQASVEQEAMIDDIVIVPEVQDATNKTKKTTRRAKQ